MSAQYLITIEPTTALSVFTAADGIDPILERVAAEARALVADASTDKGREAIRANAYRVAQSKVYLDKIGKELVGEYKEVPRKIDASRKRAWDYLEALQAEVRAPLTAWEAEQARIKAEQEAAAEAERLRIQIEHDYEVAVLMNAEFDRQRAEQRRIAAEEAAERERLAAEAGARAERERARQEIIDARLAQERAEQAARDAEEAAARERAESDQRAHEAAEQAIAAEQHRVEEAARRERAEQARREADQEHRKSINRAALAGLVRIGLTEEQGKAVVKAIIAGQIDNVSITY